MQTGFSQGTFNIDIRTGRVTATQVISEDRTTYNTIKAVQDRGMSAGLIDALYGLMFTLLYIILRRLEFLNLLYLRRFHF